MRIELLEKLIFALAVLAIVLIAGLVGVFSFVIQQSSGISHEEEVATLQVDDWLTKARAAASGEGPQTSNVLLRAAPIRGGVAVTPGKPGQGAAPAVKPPPGKRDDYIAENGETIPKEEQVSDKTPWLRKQEGVTYMMPQSVPQVVAQRYQGFEEAWQVAQQGSGEFVNGNYKINYVDPNSLLATKIGLQAGDEVISVNGHPVAGSMSQNQQLYESLKGQSQYAVKILRNGQPVVLSFYVNGQ
jgi:hypothetical protein